jgi:thimet oligopeptidase
LFAYYNRAVDKNVKLLEEAIQLRQKIASLMGYKTWADYRTDGRMAKNGTAVMTFLTGLQGKLLERERADLAKLLKFKQEYDPSAKRLEMWDIAYTAYQLKKRDYNLDDEKIKEYFPSDLVVKNMFNVYSQIFGVEYQQVVGAKVWDENVRLYKILDKQSKELIGFFFGDFIPRKGKYNHAAAFPLISGRAKVKGYSYPIASIVANFSPPSGNKPSLMTHDEVETLFHEFGHIMHQTLTRAPYASLSGSSVAQDFVEAPSQMLENWVWDKDILNMLSGHYQNPSQKLPTELVDQLLAAKDFNSGYYYTRQLFLALEDMAMHTATGPVDTTTLHDALYRKIIGVEPVKGGHFNASFGHLMGGYDAGYYGYLWSEVYAQDMFTIFKKTGLLNGDTGGKYRKIVLEKGNMVEAIDLLREFLGRDPAFEAFYEKLGIKPRVH